MIILKTTNFIILALGLSILVVFGAAMIQTESENENPFFSDFNGGEEEININFMRGDANNADHPEVDDPFDPPLWP